MNCEEMICGGYIKADHLPPFVVFCCSDILLSGMFSQNISAAFLPG